MDKIEIYIATHKKFDPPNSSLYIPIHVGKESSSLKLNILSDNTKKQISSLNKSFCELTALYWMWKNSSAQVLGLVHYRRFFYGKSISFHNSNILGAQEIIKALSEKEVIVPKAYLFRNKFIFPINTKRFYCQQHYKKDWDLLKSVVFDMHPTYIPAFKKVEKKWSLHLCNMFIAKREFVNEYCSWLFPILFRLEKEINIHTYDIYQSRIFGFIAERLFNIYLCHNHIKAKAIKIFNPERA